MAYDGAVKLDTSLDNSGIEKGVKEISGCFGGLKNTADATGKAIKAAFNSAQREIAAMQSQIQKAEAAKIPLADQAREMAAELDAAKAKLAELQKEQAAAEKALNAPKDKIMTGEEISAYIDAKAKKPELDASVVRQQKLVDDLQKKWDAVVDKIDKYDAKIDQASRSISAQQETMAGLSKQAQNIKKAEGSGGASQNEDLSEVVTAVGAALGLPTGGLSAIISFAVDALLKAVEQKKRKREERKENFLKALSKIRDKLTEAGKSASKFWSRIKSIASGAFVFNAISAALRKVSAYFSEAIASSDEMKGALANLKGAAANAAAPIISILTPALAALANAAATVFSYLAQLIAFLTGKTATAVKNVQGAAGAAKKAMAALAGFDEIQKLDDKQSGGGGGSPGINYDFEGSHPLLDELLEAVKKGQWEQIGILIGERFNEAVAGIDPVAIGDGIGTFVNNTISVMLGFFETADFFQIGATLGQTLTKALETIDWNNVGKVVGTAILTLPSIIIGFIEETDWGVVAQSISGLLVSALSPVSEWLEKVDWLKIGNAMKTLVENVDYAGLASMLFTLFGNALGAAASLLLGALNEVILWICKQLLLLPFIIVDAMIGTDVVEGFLYGMKGAMLGIFPWIVNNIFLPFINGFKEAFGIHSPAKTMIDPGSNIIYGVFAGILAAFSTISTWIKNNIFAPFIKWFEDAFGISGGSSSVMETEGGNVVGGLFAGITTAWMEIENFFNLALQWFQEIFGKLTRTARESWNGIQKTWAVVSEWFNETVIQPVAEAWGIFWSSLSGWAVDTWGSIQTVFGTVAEWFERTFAEAWEGIIGVFSPAGEIFVEIKEGVAEVFRRIVNQLIGGINSVIARPFNAINNALSKIKYANIAGIYPFSGISFISVPSIPYLAQGAVLPANKPFLAMVGDQRHGTNVEAPLTTIQEAVALVMEDQTAAILAGFEASVGVQREILEAVLGIQIGDDVLGNAVSRYTHKQSVMRGGTL